MTRRPVLLIVLAIALGACTLERGENRVWRPGDPDPGRGEFYGPWDHGTGPVPAPAQRGQILR